MRVALLISLLFILFINPIQAQQTDASIALNTAESVFKVFEKDKDFLNKKNKELNQIKHKISDYFLHYNNTKKDSATWAKLEQSLFQSFTNFTDFNSGHLINIAQRLQGVQPIRGSEISYINQAFSLFTQYLELYNYIVSKSYKLNKTYKSKSLNIIILESKINQISFFYQNYYNSIGHTKIRRILNTGDATYQKKDNELKKTVKKLLRKKFYESIRKKTANYTDIYKPVMDTAVFTEIKNNPYNKSRIKNDKKRILRYFSSDYSYKVGHFFTQQISGAIGNFIGMFRFRKGYLFKNDSLLNHIKDNLQPMDILTEKTGFALTDKLIPGHFGHIALWLGTENQLKANKLWNHPVIKPFQNRIKSGYCILETDREGTHLKTLKKFMNVDELAIIRIRKFDELALEEKENIYRNALAQLGKKYDFNFDVETSDKLVCSELLYQVFGSIHWPTNRMLKRITISPDNVISLVLYQNTPLELSYYITGGKKKKYSLKNIDNLAKELGYIKQGNTYAYPVKKCERKYQKTHKRRKKKVCTTTYQELIYQ